jgi:hypothetical protein
MSEEWRELLSEEQKGSNIFTNVKDLPDLFNQFQNGQQALGNSLFLPREDATAADQIKFYDRVREKVPGLVRKPNDEDPESTGAFWKDMGRPETADDYPAIEGMSPEQTKFMRDSAHKSNLTASQFRAMAGEMAGQATLENDTAMQQAMSAMNELNGEWGMAKDTKMTAIKMMAQHLGMDESLMESISGDVPNAQVLRLMDTVVTKIGNEGGQMERQLGENLSAVMTPMEAESMIDTLMQSDAFKSSENPGHKSAQRRLVELVGYAEAGKEASNPLGM